jgi:hypothetical protein
MKMMTVMMISVIMMILIGAALMSLPHSYDTLSYGIGSKGGHYGRGVRARRTPRRGSRHAPHPYGFRVRVSRRDRWNEWRLSRAALDLRRTEDLNDRGDWGRHLTGSTTMGWIDQMILIIGPICRHDPTTVENSSPRHWAVAPVRELIRELQDHESVIIYTKQGAAGRLARAQDYPCLPKPPSVARESAGLSQ